MFKPVLKRKSDNIYGMGSRLKTKVTGIEILDYNDIVVDIETGTHDFIANGIRVHNCNAFDIMESCKKQELPEAHLLKISDMCKENKLEDLITVGRGAFVETTVMLRRVA